jgi:GNAT superfamily N-acetyltransferase
MVILHPITPTLSSSYKAVRLRALQDAPTAFGSTYARESQFCEADWQSRATNLCTPRSIGYLAHEQDEYCGIAAGFLKEQNPQYAELVSMWVAPDHRRSGTGQLLINAIESWARRNEAHTPFNSWLPTITLRPSPSISVLDSRPPATPNPTPTIPL